PYVRYGNKFVSLKTDDPHTVSLERALELIAEKKAFDANRVIHDFTDEKIQVLNGRYGPYITDGEKNARVPKDTDPKSLTPEQCRRLLDEAPARPRRGAGRKVAARKTATRKAASEASAEDTVRRKAAGSGGTKPARKKTARKKTSKKKKVSKKKSSKKKVAGKAVSKS